VENIRRRKTFDLCRCVTRGGKSGRECETVKKKTAAALFYVCRIICAEAVGASSAEGFWIFFSLYMSTDNNNAFCLCTVAN